MSVLDDLMSGDRQRIWSASWEILRSRDENLLLDLARRLPDIERATRDVELGGMFRSNRGTLEVAFQKLRFYGDGNGGCPCSLYSSIDAYDPTREAAAGHVVVHSLTPAPDRPCYACECTRCGARYNVQEGEGHYVWWEWHRA
jgi:hypothetical protein